MGWQIIKQPNGKYCIFSSVVDNVAYYNLDKDEVVQVFIDAEAERIRKEVSRTIDELEAGEKPYYQFTKTFDEVISTIENIHGNDEATKVKSLINGV
jgi:hypothetical protein